ncbi:MAG TPA: hypothetical protein VN922_16655 [Bacteroidia bacterium]|nr:hypothetical protein [Bacteroidia bacterium]
MTPKLELKQICAYLPYGLKFKTDKGDWIYELQLIDKDRGLYLHLIDDYTDLSNWNDTDFLKAKPLVIPFSELTKEDWVEVFKAGNQTEDISPDIIEQLQGRCYIKSSRGTLMYYSFSGQFFDCKYRFNQLPAFQKLYSLHADLEDLIGKGLALNKNEYLPLTK